MNILTEIRIKKPIPVIKIFRMMVLLNCQTCINQLIIIIIKTTKALSQAAIVDIIAIMKDMVRVV